MRFHPNDKSAVAMYYRAHDRLAARDRAFVDMQGGPNPLTAAEIRTLAAKYPERYARYLGMADKMDAASEKEPDHG